jgi:hypothetical protein
MMLRNSRAKRLSRSRGAGQRCEDKRFPRLLNAARADCLSGKSAPICLAASSLLGGFGRQNHLRANWNLPSGIKAPERVQDRKVKIIRFPFFRNR